MYNKIIGQTVKVVYRDGDLISIATGEVLNYDDGLYMLEVEDTKTKKSTFIDVKTINKLKVL